MLIISIRKFSIITLIKVVKTNLKAIYILYQTNVIVKVSAYYRPPPIAIIDKDIVSKDIPLTVLLQ